MKAKMAFSTKEIDEAKTARAKAINITAATATICENVLTTEQDPDIQ